MFYIGLLALIGVLAGVLILVAPMALKAMAEADLFFTLRRTNSIKYVERGEVLDHMIPEVPGHILDNPRDRLATFREAKVDEVQPLDPINRMLDKWLGIYYYGIYPFKHIRSFPIKKVYENIQGKNPKEWLTEEKTHSDDGLRFKFPRPIVFTDIELKDRFTIDVKIVLEFQVVRPFTPIYVFNGDFFRQASSLLQGEVIDRLREMTTEDFIAKAKKGEVKGFLSDIKDPESPFNLKLIESTGLMIVSISINDYQPSDPTIVNAIRQAAIALEQGKANVVTAEQNRRANIIDSDSRAKALLVFTKAQVKSQDQLTGARERRLRATVSSLLLPGGDPTATTRAAADFLEMEAAAGEDSKLTTLVKDRSSVVTPVGGDKK